MATGLRVPSMNERLKPTAGSMLLVSIALSLLIQSVQVGLTGLQATESEVVRVEKVPFLARAYIYGGYQSNRYWNVTPFYMHQIEAHQDDLSASLKTDVLAKYDIVVLTVTDEQLTASDRAALDQFKIEGGALIPASVDAYSILPNLKQKYASGELKAKQPVLLTKAESEYLVIFYPDFVSYEDAKNSAQALHQAYEFFYHLIGDERPLRGTKIWILFNPFWKEISKDNNPIRMGGDSGIYEGRVVPPEVPFFHELVHVFTTGDKTKAAGWVDINGAFSEALANLFSYHFAVSVLEYDVASPAKLGRYGMPDRWLGSIHKYQNIGIDPYSLDWGPHRSAQPYLEAMLFVISEEHGWDIWNSFFKIAEASQQPQIPTNSRGRLENLKDKESSRSVSRFVHFLGLAAEADLKPQFESWRFKIEPIFTTQITVTATRSARTFVTSTEGVVWNVLSDGSLDLTGEGGKVAGDIEQPYVDLADFSYGFSGGLVYFRFVLRGKIANEVTTTRVDSIWYQVLIDVDSDSSTGYLWSKDFAPDYILQLSVDFDAWSKTVRAYSYVRKYFGTGRDWSWTSIRITGRFGSEATVAGGIGQDFFVLACRHQDISASKGSTLKFFARSGILYDNKVYNDPVPDSGTVTVTVPNPTIATASSGTSMERTTSPTISHTTSALGQISPVATNEIVLILLGMLLGSIVVTGYGLKKRKNLHGHERGRT